jgi:hypothetical protein
MSAINQNDRVRYSATFLRSIGERTGPMTSATGTVQAIKRIGAQVSIATIKWDTPEMPEKVAVKNLSRCDQPSPEPHER